MNSYNQDKNWETIKVTVSLESESDKHQPRWSNRETTIELAVACYVGEGTLEAKSFELLDVNNAWIDQDGGEISGNDEFDDFAEQALSKNKAYILDEVSKGETLIFI